MLYGTELLCLEYQPSKLVLLQKILFWYNYVYVCLLDKYRTVWLDLVFKISVVYTGSKVNKGIFLL